MAVEDEPIRWRIDQTGCQHQEITDHADLLLGYGDLTAWLNLIAPVKNSSHQMLSVNESDYSENQFQERIIIPIIHPTPVVSQGNWTRYLCIGILMTAEAECPISRQKITLT